MSWVNVVFNILSSIPRPKLLRVNLHARALEFSKELDKLSIAFSSIVSRYSLINVCQADADGPTNWGPVVRIPQKPIDQPM
jgi:hypothetical protein